MMIKVIQKAFDVLEYVYRHPDPVLPQDLARQFTLSQPTAVRLLRDLTELGYLEQVGARKGYRRGPMSFVLTDSPESEFVRFASFHIEETARRIGQAIVLSRRHRNWRCILCHHNHNPAFVVDADRIRTPNLYRTTSGRLLLAYADKNELDDIVRIDGLPSREDWPEIAKRRDTLDTQLAKIRHAGQVELHPSRDGQSHALALPLFRNGVLFGAVTVYWSVHADDASSERCRSAARTLIQALSETRKVIQG